MVAHMSLCILDASTVFFSPIALYVTPSKFDRFSTRKTVVATMKKSGSRYAQSSREVNQQIYTCEVWKYPPLCIGANSDQAPTGTLCKDLAY